MMLVLETDTFAPKLLLKEMSKKKKSYLQQTQLHCSLKNIYLLHAVPQRMGTFP